MVETKTTMTLGIYFDDALDSYRSTVAARLFSFPFQFFPSFFLIFFSFFFLFLVSPPILKFPLSPYRACTI